MEIISTAPGKLILFGEHASSRGKPALVFAVNLRLQVKLASHDFPNKNILLTSKEYYLKGIEYPTDRLNVVSQTVATFLEETKQSTESFELSIESNIEPGFGSSAAVIVATLGVLNEYYNTNLTREELLKLGIKSNYAVKGYGSGLDIAASLYGGLIKYQVNKKPKSLPFNELNFVIVSTCTKVPSGPIVDAVKQFEKANKKETKILFDEIKEVVLDAEKAIIATDLDRIGLLMNKNQELLRSLNVSSSILEVMIKTAISNGAYGAKLSGGGVGDNMIALIPKNKRDQIIQSLNLTNGKVLPDICIDKDGLIIKK